MNFKKTLALVFFTFLIGAGIYYFEFYKKEKDLLEKQRNEKLLQLNIDEITYFSIEKNTAENSDEKNSEQKNNSVITLQKINNEWSILEPIQDKADVIIINQILSDVDAQKLQRIEIQANVNEKNRTGPPVVTALELKEFGLEKPLAKIIFKNNQGRSQKINVGAEKNFENLPFIQIDDKPIISVGKTSWLDIVEKNVTHFREKRLYRQDLGKIVKVEVTSLNDRFVLAKDKQKWSSPEHPDFVLDQNLVRESIKTWAESAVRDYLTEAEPSEKDKTKKGLAAPKVHLRFETEQDSWDVSLNLDEKDKALYALTSRPTHLTVLDVSRWEKFANATLDQLRDRTTLMSFSKNEVEKIFYKYNTIETQLENQNSTWILKSPLPDKADFNPLAVEKFLDRLHDLKISEFVIPEVAKKFSGQNMAMLKAGNDKLIFQLNWGPLVKLPFRGIEKEVYLARTQISPMIFALEKDKIELLGFSDILKGMAK